MCRERGRRRRRRPRQLSIARSVGGEKGCARRQAGRQLSQLTPSQVPRHYPGSFKRSNSFDPRGILNYRTLICFSKKWLGCLLSLTTSVQGPPVLMRFRSPISHLPLLLFLLYFLSSLVLSSAVRDFITLQNQLCRSTWVSFRGFAAPSKAYLH